MKQKIKFIGLLTVVFLVFFSTESNMVSASVPAFRPILPGKKTTGSVKLKTKEIKSSSEALIVDLKIPVLSGMANKELQNKLNTKFLSDALDFKDEINKEALEFEKFAKEHNIPQRPFEANLSYKVTYNKNYLLSIIFYYYRFTGGAHGGTKVISYNIDLKGGKTLALGDLFKPDTDYKEKINTEILKQMKTNGKPYFQNAFKSISESQAFYAEDGDLVIYFQEYEIAPYAAGIPEFRIPLSLFQGNLSPNLNLQYPINTTYFNPLFIKGDTPPISG